ncbi:hypothetical protein [Aquimarina muelleri]|uniref:Uncharacterized protein n=1 Tax=Aquimarina muelleri TaxID=279356 RepID=A0A918JU97_9FLAO|nr:hypothetical protein [Aquimarina muelleri]MCX2761966.1 hypothetical protein [Aquimarina muelleri]GGX10732.1 hypothetical protein GCM10007384_10580 [Aquimarina muelleri]
MKTQLVTMFDMFFGAKSKNKIVEDSTSKLFLTHTDTFSGRTLVIEEEAYTVWAYLLCENKENIDFDGFLCAVTNPFTANNITLQKITPTKKDIPFPSVFANEYSYVENLKKKDIKINWRKDHINIFIKTSLYLIMNIKEKCSYSKALTKDCDYGMQLHY